MNLKLKSWDYYLKLITDNINTWDYYAKLIYTHKLTVAAILLSLFLFYWLARKHYLKTVRYFRSGDIIQVRKLTGKPRSGVLSRFNNKNIYFIPNNSYQIVQRKWYYFFLIENLSLQERSK